MIRGRDFAIVDLSRIDFPQVQSRRRGTAPLHAELLIEIAVVNFAATLFTSLPSVKDRQYLPNKTRGLFLLR